MEQTKPEAVTELQPLLKFQNEPLQNACPGSSKVLSPQGIAGICLRSNRLLFIIYVCLPNNRL